MSPAADMLLTGAESLLALIALKASVVLAIGFVITRIARRLSAAHRSACWTAVTVSLLVLPILSLTLPTVPVPGIERPAAARWLTVARSQPPATIAATVGERPVDDVEPPVAASRDATAGVLGALKPIQVPAVLALGALWAIGVVTLIGRLLRDVWAARGLRRRGALVPADSVLYTATAAATRDIRLRRRVELRLSNDVAVPSMVGAGRPCVLLPREALDWGEQRLHDVLVHELAHVARHDYVQALLWQLACAVYWVNPLVWRAARTARVEQERAADDHVVLAGTEPVAYAEQLLEFARELRAESRGALTFGVATPLVPLKERLRAILDPTTNRRRVTMRGSVAVAATAATVALPLASLGVIATRPDAVLGPATVTSSPRQRTRDSTDWVPTSASTGRDSVVFQLLFLSNRAERVATVRSLNNTEATVVVDDLLGIFDEFNERCRDMRWRAARGLREAGDERALPRLVAQLLADPDPAVRAMVANAIAATGSDEGARLLRAAVRGGTPETFARVGRALDTLGDRRDRQRLFGALRQARAESPGNTAIPEPRRS